MCSTSDLRFYTAYLAAEAALALSFSSFYSAFLSLSPRSLFCSSVLSFQASNSLSFLCRLGMYTLSYLPILVAHSSASLSTKSTYMSCRPFSTFSTLYSNSNNGIASCIRASLCSIVVDYFFNASWSISSDIFI